MITKPTHAARREFLHQEDFLNLTFQIEALEHEAMDFLRAGDPDSALLVFNRMTESINEFFHKNLDYWVIDNFCYSMVSNLKNSTHDAIEAHGTDEQWF